jgi:hypothetical protein
MLTTPHRYPTFDRFGDKIIMRVSFTNPDMGHHTVDTYVVDITKLVAQTQDNELMQIVNRLLNG